MEDTPIVKLLLRLSPPVMLALLVQAIYNIVDSYFVASYSGAGLTALSIIFPIQLLMTAIANGTGTGSNLILSRMDGRGEFKDQGTVIKNSLFLGAFNYVVFAVVSLLLVKPYFEMSSDIAQVQSQGIEYAQIVFAGSLFLFVESICGKILQSKGNMFTPMLAQIVGALANLILDPILIFGKLGMPELGVGGAAIATVIGQMIVMIITLYAVCSRYSPWACSKYFRGAAGAPHYTWGKLSLGHCLEVYKNGLPAMAMQSLCTIYIVGLNLILKGFTEDAVTVLGIYYKIQSFFFIPMYGLQQVILPIVSFNYGAERWDRVRDVLKYSVMACCGLMVVATGIFILFPAQILSIFSDSPQIMEIGCYALPVISVNFVPAGLAIMLNVYFQGVEQGKISMALTILRQIVLLVPLAWAFSLLGLKYVWFTFPVTEITVALVGLLLYKRGQHGGKQLAERR